MVKRISTIVREILPLHTEVLDPVRPRISISYQKITKDSEGEKVYPTPVKRRLTMSRFYEATTASFYGGRLGDTKYNVWEINGGLMPDVVNEQLEIEFESKANVSGKRLGITTLQFLKYQRSQFINPRWKFLYTIYRHSLHGIERVKRSDWAVIKGLSETTMHSVILPLSVLVGLSENENGGLTSTYSNENSEWEDVFLINSSVTNRFLTEPEGVLEDAKLDPGEYIFERLLSPPNFRVNGRWDLGFREYWRGEINQFPIMRIRDRDHGAWVQKFMADYESRLGSEELEEIMERKAIQQEDSEELDDELPF